jgi:hypothetical protein
VSSRRRFFTGARRLPAAAVGGGAPARSATACLSSSSVSAFHRHEVCLAGHDAIPATSGHRSRQLRAMRPLRGGSTISRHRRTAGNPAHKVAAGVLIARARSGQHDHGQRTARLLPAAAAACFIARPLNISGGARRAHAPRRRTRPTAGDVTHAAIRQQHGITGDDGLRR